MNSRDHQHLAVKALMEGLRGSAAGWLRQRLREMNVDYYTLDEERRRTVLAGLMAEMRESAEGQQLLSNLNNQLSQQIDSMNLSATRKQTYLIDCLREATAFPIARQREGLAFNLQPLHARDIGREMRRVVWSRVFNGDRLRMSFSKWDREVTPFKVREELRMALEKASLQHGVSLKQNQTEIAMRIVQYFLKAQGKLPQKYHFYIALTLVELYSFTAVGRVVEVGAVGLGVVELLEYYNEQTEVRLQRLRRTLDIVDGDTFAIIEKEYLSGGNAVHGTRQLLECFQLFRLTAGSFFLPLSTAQFIIDQLIIRKRCRLDIYTLFGIMVLILSDQFAEGTGRGSLRDLMERARTVVRPEEFVEAYAVIYADIPPFFDADQLGRHPNNRLLAEMLAIERVQVMEEEEEGEFVVNVGGLARVGKK